MYQNKQINVRFAKLENLAAANRAAQKKANFKQFKSQVLLGMVCIFIGIGLGYAWRMHHDQKLVAKASQAIIKAERLIETNRQAFTPRVIINSIKSKGQK
jgi:hypothetical protein